MVKLIGLSRYYRKKWMVNSKEGIILVCWVRCQSVKNIYLKYDDFIYFYFPLLIIANHILSKYAIRYSYVWNDKIICIDHWSYNI